MSVPLNEAVRIEALNRYDFPPGAFEPEFSDLVALAAAACRTPIAFIGFVDRTRLWFKSAIGVSTPHAPRRFLRCARDLQLRPSHSCPGLCPSRTGCPIVTHNPQMRFYADAPLVEPTGHTIGMLAVADFVTRGVSDLERSTLRTLGRQVIQLLELGQTVRRLEGEIAERAHYERRIAAFQRQLRISNDLLSAASVTDSLTQIGNRRAFEQRLTAEINRANRFLYSLSMLMIDVDHFKQINDTFGHPAGDQVIHQVAQVLAGAIRTTDFVARLGGDEFAVILPGTDLPGAEVIAERCRAAIERLRSPCGRVRISIGVAHITPGSLDGSELIAAADQSLLCAKRAGRNRVSSNSAKLLS